ncbi:transglycosylase SLT domain-containing protein [Halorhodospira halophila]|uniref:Lytic transglycosylase, catalytic n=1 Tax=Halorhodospira halophila (strain DSM 244 / SL1) TaxID=349124 RepID=A1WTS9_HALHL|nr:transglycosylase SLT domain-containing protein [Halorhodospira halophila]ABM61091.1 Lytic transglycosylase, catalytic [Halorhodospira halophila SL1]MBK1729808.1 hypothetical protein [Halorhodospira halophila]
MDTRRWVLSALIGTLAVPGAVHAGDALEQFREQQRESFDDFATDFRERYADFRDTFHEELEAYQEELSQRWEEPRVSDRREWVQYGDDQASRTVVDYARNEIVVDVPGEGREAVQAAAQRLDELLQTTLAEAYEGDEVTQRTWDRLDIPESETTAAGNSDEQRVLSEISAEDVEEMMAQAKAEQRQEPEGDGRRDILSFSVPMPESRASDKAEEFREDVEAEAERYDVDPALMLAVMHSESSFNPMARSHIPAYGLMQIVPESAGRDVAQRVYGEQRLFSPDYLYNPDNNIRAGAVYLDILDSSYLSAIEDPESRLYAVISAYNTGAGNVARAFVDGTNVSAAAEVINDMSPDEVYETLAENLPYEETRNYLVNVASRHQAYRDF